MPKRENLGVGNHSTQEDADSSWVAMKTCVPGFGGVVQGVRLGCGADMLARAGVLSRRLLY